MEPKTGITSQIFGYWKFALLTILLIQHGGVNAAKEIQTLESVHTAIKNFINSSYDKSAKLEIKIGLNDKRLRLARCNQQLNVFWSSGNRKLGNTAVGISCNGDTNWTLYAPVQIKVYKAVVVAQNTLSRLDTLNAADIQMEEHDISMLSNGYITRPQKYLGYTLKRALPAGFVLSPNILSAPRMVKRGEKVTLVASTKGIKVHMQGTALSDGGAGETIKIRNLSSSRVIDGTIVSHGIVKVHL